ncbi:XdhC family protein [Breoghania sp. L-A4]|uniref:XdhC family protein n=1 Tax=Breoghania sp. L-A4 TaxID=2304600 RepID=UPI0020BF0843|nr:XdhC family protein [Breoghania sp. L-A4]
MAGWAQVADNIEAQGACVLVSIIETRGSAPREAGARMVVRPDGGFHGTIGGGRLEWQALAQAQKLFAAPQGFVTREHVLGPISASAAAAA